MTRARWDPGAWPRPLRLLALFVLLAFVSGAAGAVFVTRQGHDVRTSLAWGLYVGGTLALVLGAGPMAFLPGRFHAAEQPADARRASLLRRVRPRLFWFPFGAGLLALGVLIELV